MLSVQRLRVLREVAARGSFSAAAEALDFTQSAVSQQIAALERDAKTKLLERGRGGVRPTEAGAILVSHTDAILGRLSDAERELEAYVGLRAGRLRLAAFESAGATLIPRAVRSFHERHPEVELGVVQMEPEEAAQRLRRRELDLAVVYDLEPPTGALGEELELTHLSDDHYDAVLSRGHPLAGRRSLRLGDLAGETWINTTRRDLCQRIILSSCERAGFRPRVACEIDEIPTSQALVATGIGVTLLPSLGLEQPHPGVVVKSLGPDAPVRRIFAARARGLAPAPAVEAMVGVLGEVTEPG